MLPTLTCAQKIIDRVVSLTYVGRSNFIADKNFQGKIAGVYTVDAALSEEEISKITRRMYAGIDTL